MRSNSSSSGAKTVIFPLASTARTPQQSELRKALAKPAVSRGAVTVAAFWPGVGFTRVDSGAGDNNGH
jgi:hypothetical protein